MEGYLLNNSPASSTKSTSSNSSSLVSKRIPKGQHAKITVPIEVVHVIQEILLKFKPEGIPVEELPPLFKMATDQELDYKKYGTANNISDFLRLSCFNNVCDVRKRPRKGDYVKGCALGLTSLPLLRNALEPEPNVRQPAPICDASTPPQLPQITASPPAAIPEPQEDLLAIKEKATEQDEKKNVKMEDAKPKVEKENEDMARSSGGKGESDKNSSTTATEQKSTILPCVPVGPVNTCTIIALPSQIQQEAAEKRQTIAHESIGMQPQVTVMEVQQQSENLNVAAPAGQPQVPQSQSSSASLATHGRQEDNSAFWMVSMNSMVKNFEEMMKVQQEGMKQIIMTVTDTFAKIGTPGTPKHKIRSFHSPYCGHGGKNHGKWYTDEKRTSRSQTTKKLEFLDPDEFKAKVKYYATKYGKKDDAIHPEHNFYMVHMRNLDQRLDNHDIRKMFPKAVYASFGVSKNGNKGKILNLLFKRPEYTRHAYKMAKVAFRGGAVIIQYGNNRKLNN